VITPTEVDYPLKLWLEKRVGFFGNKIIDRSMFIRKKPIFILNSTKFAKTTF
jgi:hypothetical protein